MHKQQYKHPLDTILNNIQETQDKLLVVFFHGRGELHQQSEESYIKTKYTWK